MRIVIELRQELYNELRLAAADCGELDEVEVCSPQQFARECIESVLASRRVDLNLFATTSAKDLRAVRQSRRMRAALPT